MTIPSLMNVNTPWRPEAATLGHLRGRSFVHYDAASGGRLLVLGVRLQHEIADAILRFGVSDRSQQHEAPTVAVDCELASRQGHVSRSAVTCFPDGEPDELQTIEFPTGEVQLRLCELAPRRVAVIVLNLDFDRAHLAFTREPTRTGPVTIAILSDTCGNLIQLYQPA